MKLRYYIFFLFFLVGASCKKENHSNSSLIGRWQETETWMGIGGPPTWTPSTTHQVIEFTLDGKLLGLPEINRYKILTDSTLQVWSTNGTYNNYTWRIMELSSTKLELYQSCFEGCGGRYVAIK